VVLLLEESVKQLPIFDGRTTQQNQLFHRYHCSEANGEIRIGRDDRMHEAQEPKRSFYGASRNGLILL
jgi:hypothetical protein